MNVRVTALVWCIPFVSHVALAQPPPAAAPPAAAAPAAAPGATPVVDPAAPAAPGTAAPATEEEKGRFRWGISGYGGPLLGGLSGGAGGIDARFGWQINNTVAVYGQPMLMLGAGATAGVTGASASGIALYGVGGLVEATLGNMFYMAAGPEILTGAMGSSSVGVGSAAASASTGPYFSVAARVGLALGSVKPNRRKAFTIGLDFRAIFNPGDPVIVPGIALGYDAY